ncbi:ABC-type transport auxiliary lipoprotein family protein [Breoghania sp.]|uniref:ABC-type transport auxiliary lipoprotein family protein n=1 Tax=Breoghania sp. TaxID=2065378 RepID=UPI002612922D|nr:ABC-type transport auxiliary lipoprotein family protein [Breoghania sp.]MDJ0931233.1 ABC-type transport auxiliary lipoprotein family protein [Breoghania sp.]
MASSTPCKEHGQGTTDDMMWHKRIAKAARQGAVGALLTAAVSGCAAVTGGPAPRDIYTLGAPTDFAGKAHHSRAQLLIASPHTLAALDTDNIAVISDGIAMSYFGGAAWSDRVQRLLQSKMIEAFENSGGVRAVGQPGEGLLIDYQIVTDIRAFQLAVDGRRTAQVAFSAKIINDRNGKVVASRTFRAEVRVSGDTVDDAVTAINSATNQCLVDLVTWTLGRV